MEAARQPKSLPRKAVLPQSAICLPACSILHPKLASLSHLYNGYLNNTLVSALARASGERVILNYFSLWVMILKIG